MNCSGLPGVRRLELSTEYLSRSSMTLDAIAVESGNGDRYLLSKALHHSFGVWPAEWRSAALDKSKP